MLVHCLHQTTNHQHQQAKAPKLKADSPYITLKTTTTEHSRLQCNIVEITIEKLLERRVKMQHNGPPNSKDSLNLRPASAPHLVISFFMWFFCEHLINSLSAGIQHCGPVRHHHHPEGWDHRRGIWCINKASWDVSWDPGLILHQRTRTTAHIVNYAPPRSSEHCTPTETLRQDFIDFMM